MAHAAKANAADAKAAHVTTRTPAQVASIVNPCLKFRFRLQPLGFRDLTGLGHNFLLLFEPKSGQPRQSSALPVH
jgi:hypothetical protein